MPRTEVDEAAAAAYKAVKRKALEEHDGNTQPLLVVYAVESFLRRLAISSYRDRMVLKGGMLMTASSIRRMTKDADLATHGVSNDESHVKDVGSTSRSTSRSAIPERPRRSSSFQ